MARPIFEHLRFPSRSSTVTLLCCAWLGMMGGCSSSTSTEVDGSAIVDASVDTTPIDATATDVDVSDDAASDAAPGDVPDDVFGDAAAADALSIDSPGAVDGEGDADADADSNAGCTCAVLDAGIGPPRLGYLSLPCYCAKQDWGDNFNVRPTCPTYDEAVACADSSRPMNVFRYKNCNVVAVHYPVDNAVDMRVYDARTHELVGAMRANDYGLTRCEGTPVNGIQSGVIPGPECEVADQWFSCTTGDAGDPGDAADAGCTCTTSEEDAWWQRSGQMSLPCYCSRFRFGQCPTYEQAFGECPIPNEISAMRLDEYADCNLTVITQRGAYYGQTSLFDYTTHALVGADSYSDVGSACGTSNVSTFRAGVALDSSCVRTKSIDRCAPDGGEADSD